MYISNQFLTKNSKGEKAEQYFIICKIMFKLALESVKNPKHWCI